MQPKNLLPLLFLCCSSCKHKEQDKVKPGKFDKIKWAAMKDNEYLYRDQMLNDLVFNHSLKGLKKEEILTLLGTPNKTDNGHLFYTISSEYFGNTLWPMHIKTLVLKLTSDSTVEWRKIHE